MILIFQRHYTSVHTHGFVQAFRNNSLKLKANLQIENQRDGIHWEIYIFNPID